MAGCGDDHGDKDHAAGTRERVTGGSRIACGGHEQGRGGRPSNIVLAVFQGNTDRRRALLAPGLALPQPLSQNPTG